MARTANQFSKCFILKNQLDEEQKIKRSFAIGKQKIRGNEMRLLFKGQPINLDNVQTCPQNSNGATKQSVTRLQRYEFKQHKTATG